LPSWLKKKKLTEAKQQAVRAKIQLVKVAISSNIPTYYSNADGCDPFVFVAYTLATLHAPVSKTPSSERSCVRVGAINDVIVLPSRSTGF